MIILVPIALAIMAGFRVLFVEYVPFFQDFITVIIADIVIFFGITEATFMILKLFFQSAILWIIFKFLHKL